MFQVKKMATPQEDRTMVGGSTECIENESRGVKRGHVPVGFQKDHSRFILSHCSGSWREFEKGVFQGGQRELLAALISIGHLLGTPGVTKVPHPQATGKGSYPAHSMVQSQWLPSFLLQSKQNQKHMVLASPTQTAAAWNTCKRSFKVVL